MNPHKSGILQFSTISAAQHLLVRAGEVGLGSKCEELTASKFGLLRPFWETSALGVAI